MSEGAGEGAEQPFDVAALNAVLASARTILAEATEHLAEIETAKASLIEANNAAHSRLSEISEAATAALALKTKVVDEQAVIATKSAHIQQAQEHADKVRAELDRVQTAVVQQATEAEGLRVRAQAAVDGIGPLVTAIQGHKITTEAEVALAIAAREGAIAAAAVTKALADKSENIEQRVTDYEKRIAELEEQSKTQLATITGLLPGATAAGLASAFDKRRETFLNPTTRWQWIFILSVLLLIVLAATGFWNVYTSGIAPDWDELFRLWAARVPIAAALIWLAVHASHETALAKRLEEDYGFKAATAKSFQGFQIQMADIESKVSIDSPLAKLCKDTLEIIASPPGRIYDKHQLTVSPSKELAKEVAEAVAKVLPTGKPG